MGPWRPLASALAETPPEQARDRAFKAYKTLRGVFGHMDAGGTLATWAQRARQNAGFDSVHLPETALVRSRTYPQRPTTDLHRRSQSQPIQRKSSVGSPAEAEVDHQGYDVREVPRYVHDVRAGGKVAELEFLRPGDGWHSFAVANAASRRSTRTRARRPESRGRDGVGGRRPRRRRRGLGPFES